MGVLLAIEANDRRMWAIHHLALEDGRRLIVPAVVVAQAWRDARRQVQLGRFLRSCEEVAIGPEVGRAAGALCGKAGTRDVVDACVIVVALARGAIVFTSDRGDLTHLAEASGIKPGLVIRQV
ncbi:type II toxin-antitoxin system VapC family toxin [Microlunatus parietis]